MKMKTLIVTGGQANEKLIRNIINNEKFDNIIASDRGLEIICKCSIKPNYIIGDFDSVCKNTLKEYENNSNIKIIRLNPEKDFTDTHMALKLAIEIKSDEIIIIGATGTRLDHTIANINILKETLDNNIECKLINEKNEIKLIDKKTTIIKDKEFRYVSIIPLTTTVEGVTLTGFKYKLNNAKLKIGESIGISNEQIEDKAMIDIKNGILIVIKSRD